MSASVAVPDRACRAFENGFTSDTSKIVDCYRQLPPFAPFVGDVLNAGLCFAVALILGVHRLLSSAFVSVNILGNALATIVIAQWESAVDRKLLLAGLTEGRAMTEPITSS